MTRRMLIVSVLVLAAIGLLVAASGIVPTKASSGHWRITEWFLRFSMHRSAATHSLGVDVPPLDDEGLIIKGASHYEFGCRACHAAPGKAFSPVAEAMLPPPADLTVSVPESTPAKLFHVVKHGVKFTGMPAFPSQERDDEVWAVVAFLLKLPELDEAGYQRLIGGKPALPDVPETAPPEDRLFANVNRRCQQCHGSDGLGRGGTIPRIAGQRIDYLHHTLEAFVSGRRASGIMQTAAASLDETMIRRLAAHYSQLPATASASPEPASTGSGMDSFALDHAPVEADVIEQGRRIAHKGVRERRVPSCVECHEPSRRRANPAYPTLAGLSADYLALQLELFKDGRRAGSPYAHLMQPAVARLKPEEMRAVAQYFASLPPRPSAAIEPEPR